MARNKSIDHKTRAKQLKKLGVVNYDLRHNLTKGQKAAISRKWKTYSEAATDKKGEFARRTVAPATAKQFRDAGYLTYKNRVFVPKIGYKKVQIRGNVIIRRGVNKYSREVVERGENLLRRLERMGERELPDGQYMTVRIGNNSRFSMRFKTADELMHYISLFTPKDKNADKDDLISAMSLVTFTDVNE